MELPVEKVGLQLGRCMQWHAVAILCQCSLVSGSPHFKLIRNLVPRFFWLHCSLDLACCILEMGMAWKLSTLKVSGLIKVLERCVGDTMVTKT